MHLLQKSVSFFGHMFTEDGTGTDPAKLKAVAEWPSPTCSKDVRAFLGLAEHYRRFTQDFSASAAPWNYLIKKELMSGYLVRCRSKVILFPKIRIDFTTQTCDVNKRR
jgi:hypothetical protein